MAKKQSFGEKVGDAKKTSKNHIMLPQIRLIIFVQSNKSSRSKNTSVFWFMEHDELKHQSNIAYIATLIALGTDYRLGIQTRGIFSPHNGGEKDFRWLFSPHYAGPWGKKQLFFTPHFRDPGGKIESFFPPYGGKKVRRRRKILRIWRSKMPNSLNKNVF